MPTGTGGGTSPSNETNWDEIISVLQTCETNTHLSDRQLSAIRTVTNEIARPEVRDILMKQQHSMSRTAGAGGGASSHSGGMGYGNR